MASVIEAISQAVGLSVPGAPSPAQSASSKPKKSKKKNSAPTAAVETSTGTTGEGIPEAAPAQAQAVEQTTPAAAASGPSKEKGPVEEVIAKRMRTLGKKIQRFKGYAAQPPTSLNNDQRSAIASLPNLEGIYRELEDLSKQVEYVELEQAGKVREIREQAQKETEGVASTKVTEFQTSLSTPLSLFLRLHSLLHPARPSDHEHLTFGRLELPSNLQDVVQATDVLRVGRMYEDLIAGGESGAAIISGLVKGPVGDDEENDHVHHLLDLLSESDSLPVEEAALEAEEEVTETPEAEPVPEVVQPVSAPRSEQGLPNGHGEDTTVESEDVPAPSEAPAAGRSGALNFLQEDELAEEESFEVVPKLAAHQTSGQQPVHESYAPAALEAPISTTTGSGVLSPAPAAPTPPANFDWTAEDDVDDETGAQQIRDAFALSGSATPALTSQVEETPVQTEEAEEPAIALIQENELANAHITQSVNASAVDAPTAVDSSIAPAPTAAKNVPVQTQGQQKQHRQRHASGAKGGQVRQEQAKLPAKPKFDDDGFQVVGRQAPAPTPSRGRGRGRGDFAGGRGGGRGGAGAGRGRGGPGPRGGSRSTSQAQVPQDGQSQPKPQGQGPVQTRPPRQNRQPSQAQSKPAAAAPAPAPAQA
ncbi:hypothetical protein CI109_101283 [Kwoniella shandongensis]|uniref:Uncharacterized protein n=1 Tax=Kwoniella shandongensis TaxID=1734106 RepID=A0A5M6BY63_9TREE|nr:uncharacterized protein CI109_005342 [Kwoniella shandongensis]KAA5526385.1 hypothetical protein CI109_005342 [Kwoniella shandongensis]